MSPGGPMSSGWGGGSDIQNSWGHESYGTHHWTTTPLVVPEVSTTTTTVIIPEISVITDYRKITDYVYSTTTIPPKLLTTTLTTSLSGSISTYVSTVTRPGTTSLITKSVTKTLPPIIKSVTRTLPPIIEETTVTTSLRGSETTLVSTTTRPGSTIIETEETTLTVNGPTIVETETTTATTSIEATKTEVILEVSGTTITAVGPSQTITNVVTGPPCPSPAINNFFDVQWYIYTPPASDIPPMATHQPIVYPNNVTSTSIICNTKVFEQYLRTQAFDCRLGRGPYQTLDCNCNIIVGPVFTGNGPTPVGPGITVTQSGPTGTILDLGTSISGNYIPVTGAGGQSSCATTTTTILSTPLIYTGEVVIVPSFYRTVQAGKRDLTSVISTTKVKLPGLVTESKISPFNKRLASLTSSGTGNKVTFAGAFTTTNDPIPYSSTPTVLPESSISITPAAQPQSSTTTENTTSPSSPAPSGSPPASSTTTPPSPPPPQGSSSTTNALPPPQSSASVTGLMNRVHTTEVCQVVTYTGQTGFIVPELSIDAENSTMTETAPWTATRAAEVSSGTAASSSATVSPATGDAFKVLPSWELLTALIWLCVHLTFV